MQQFDHNSSLYVSNDQPNYRAIYQQQYGHFAVFECGVLTLKILHVTC